MTPELMHNAGFNPIVLTSVDGSTAAVCPYGAHVISWKPAGRSERLFLSASSEFKEGKAIRGGIPIIFPQFDKLGPLQKHGFARMLRWDAMPTVCSSSGISVSFVLNDSESTRQIWPYRFRAEVRISVGGNRLTVDLSVKNTGSEPFSFTAALHTYCRVDNIQAATVEGLSGIRYHDTRQTPWIEGVEGGAEIRFAGEYDRNYYAAPRAVLLRCPAYTTRIEAEGFPDLVLWNPGPVLSAELKDMEPDGYQRFVCIEAAAIEKPVNISPGEHWHGSQTLIAEH